MRVAAGARALPCWAGKRGQSPFAGTARRVLSINGDCPPFPIPAVRLELLSGRLPSLSGPWQCEVLRNGRPMPPVSAWRSTCRVRDADVDYCELVIELRGGLSIERHLILARKDRFLLLADAVIGARAGSLQYRSVLPLATGVSLRLPRQTCEGFLVGPLRRRLAAVLPLALPEWKKAPGLRRKALGPTMLRMVPAGGVVESSAGQLLATPGALELRQAAAGRSLFAPLWFDLDPGRARRRLTWRHLTVAESMARIRDDMAVGYRVAAGSGQWLVYRSLAPKRNRTVLGHNLSTETLVARFRRNGEVESIIEIE